MTGNRSDLLPAIRAKLWFQQYRDPQNTSGLDPCEDVELIQCSMATMKTPLLLLNPRFNKQPHSRFQCPGVDLPREAEECDPSVVVT